ncbi:hypothetical protein CBER1_08552 [Cercospora berteroae]|uniref:SP-RING-type domain-containing protein n=1 Tax=Cercospora berteroae TaxID=357750 RepID=A0A2S6BV83_9PEZI|nr:hypothetical protein CBER1_08552 [Cercospora berteroae]
MLAPDERLAKRKRHEGPTPPAIAQSNAGQQGRWMSKRLDNSARAPPAPPPTQNSLSTTNGVLSLDEDDDTNGQEAPIAPARHLNAFEAGALGSVPDLVRYSVPSTLSMVDPETALPGVQLLARKSMDPTTRSAPSLPSPAPSDENTNSPTLAENQINALRSRQLSGQARLSMDHNITNIRPPVPRSPLTMQSPGLPRQQISQSSLPNPSPLPRAVAGPVSATLPHQSTAYAQPPLPSPLVAPQSQTLHQRRGFQGHPQRRQLSGPTLLSDAPPLQSPPIASMGSVGHGHPQQLQHVTQIPAASRVPKETLLARLKTKTSELHAVLSNVDHGRLKLLRDAVEKEDWFYQILSQIFCLHSVMPSLLPKSLKDVPGGSWDAVEGLICSNDSVNKELLNFFADFPEPIMEIYSDSLNIREVYEQRARSVKAFLAALPKYWLLMLNKGFETRAPPLVEDMVDVLRLHSIVLQTTCFRAIARRFWGLKDTPGTEAIIRLHELDQQAYPYIMQGWRRNEQEKLQALAAFRSLFTIWNSYQQQRQQLDGASDTFPVFSIPPEIEAVFRMMPPSLASKLQPPHQPQPRVMQQQQQQRQQILPRSIHQQSQSPIQQSPLQTRASSQMWAQPQPHVNMPPPSPMLAYSGGQTPLQSPVFAGQSHGVLAMPSPNVPPNSAAQPGQARLVKTRVFPTFEETPRPQPTHPDSNRSALHQAYLRSPILKASDTDVDASKLFRHVVGYALPPATIRKKSSVQVATFNLSHTTFRRIPKTVSSTIPGAPKVRTIDENSVLYRVRCCAVPAAGYTTESSWVVADNTWPEELSFELNGVQLDCRRKLHHGRYLPIDVTSYVLSGENKLKILNSRLADDKRKFDFAVAVEEIGIMSYDSIKQNLGLISEQDSLAAIKKALAGSDDDADDEIAVTSSNMTISMVEPLSQARLVDTPVRGVNCLHKDVFDLDVLLSVCKRQKPDWPAVVDCWRCPLCRGDVRPQTLIVDEFLVKVRAELERRNALDTKAIIIDADGNWKPKIEERTGVRSPSLERKGGSRRASAGPPKGVEIIELD